MKPRYASIPIGEVQCHPRNARRGDVPAIAKSLAEHGQYRPLAVQESTSFVVAGNHTLKAARSLGWAEVEVGWLDIDDDEALRILLVDNTTADLASYEAGTLEELLHELHRTPRGLEGTGFTPKSLDQLIADNSPKLDGDERYTPAWMFEGMNVEFDLDLAGPAGGIDYLPAARTITKEDDSLTVDWSGNFAWCNPPFSSAADFGRKWLAEIEEGVWLGPMSHSTQYRVDLMKSAENIWFPNELEFHLLGGAAEGIAFPVFVAGFGKRGRLALDNLFKRKPDRGILAQIVKP